MIVAGVGIKRKRAPSQVAAKLFSFCLSFPAVLILSEGGSGVSMTAYMSVAPFTTLYEL